MGVFEQPDIGGGGSSNSVREAPELQFAVEMPQAPCRHQRHSHRRSASMGSHPGGVTGSAQLQHHHYGHRDRRRHHHHHHGGGSGKRETLKRAAHCRSDSARGEDYLGQLGSGASTVRHHSSDHKGNALPPLNASSISFYGGAFCDSKQKKNGSAADDHLRLSYGSAMGTMKAGGGGGFGAFGAPPVADVNPHGHKRQRSNDLGGLPLPHLLGPIQHHQRHHSQGGLAAAAGIEMTTVGGRNYATKVLSAAKEQQRHGEHPPAVVLNTSGASLGSVEEVPKDSCRDFDVL